MQAPSRFIHFYHILLQTVWQTSINEALLQLINTVHMIIHTFAAA